MTESSSAKLGNPVIYLARHLWKYSAGNRKNVVLYTALFVVANGLNLVEPLILAKILNTIQEQGITQANLPTLVAWLSLFVVLTGVFWVFHGPARVMERRNAFLARANYKRYLLEGVMVLPMEWHTDHHSGDTIDKIQKGTDGLFKFAEDTFVVIESIVRLVGSFIALMYFHWQSGFLIMFSTVIALWIIAAFDRVLIRQYKELNAAENRISEKVYDSVSNITTIIILRVERLVASDILKHVFRPLRLFHVNNKVNETKWFLVSMLSSVVTFLILGWYIASAALAGAAIMVGTLYALYGYVGRITDLFFRFAYLYGDIVRQRTRVANAEEVSREFQKRRKLKQVPMTGWKELKIKDLAFSYHTEEGADLHLDDISLVIRKGEKTALIGESGSGKTTLLKVIRELYHPRQMELYLDGKGVKTGFQAISENIALIPQDPEIFATTILENITLGVNREMPVVRKFTDMACFTEVVERLPKKFQSSIVEKGVNLSGGEKQRLALARGLLACEDKEIILLDEPTSSVDSKNEMAIFQNIFRAFGDRAILASVHRLHLLPMFDRIYWFRNGKIVAEGSFDEMLSGSAEFRAQWEKYVQAQKAGREE